MMLMMMVVVKVTILIHGIFRPAWQDQMRRRVQCFSSRKFRFIVDAGRGRKVLRKDKRTKVRQNQGEKNQMLSKAVFKLDLPCWNSFEVMCKFVTWRDVCCTFVAVVLRLPASDPASELDSVLRTHAVDCWPKFVRDSVLKFDPKMIISSIDWLTRVRMCVHPTLTT